MNAKLDSEKAETKLKITPIEGTVIEKIISVA